MPNQNVTDFQFQLWYVKSLGLSFLPCQKERVRQTEDYTFSSIHQKTKDKGQAITPKSGNIVTSRETGKTKISFT